MLSQNTMSPEGPKKGLYKKGQNMVNLTGTLSVELVDENIWEKRDKSKRGYKFDIRVSLDGKFICKFRGCRLLNSRDGKGSHVFPASAGAGKYYWETALFSLTFLEAVLGCVLGSGVYQTAVAEGIIESVGKPDDHPALPSILREEAL